MAAPPFSENELLGLASRYGTPIFVIDERTLRAKVTELESAYSQFHGPVRIAYSIKANFNPAVLRVFISEGILFDVTSIGELYFFQQCSGSASHVLYTSVTEEFQELETVLRAGVSSIVISSKTGLENLIRAARRTGRQPEVLIRVNPEVGVKAEVRSSYRHGKFGVPLNGATSESAINLLRRIRTATEVVFSGFHFHLGSQIEDPSCFIHAIEKLETFILKIKREDPNFHVKVIDIGGGMAVFYGKPVPQPGDVGRLTTSRLNQMLERTGEQPTLIVESGRYLSAEGCVLISRIVNTKEYASSKFVYVDAGYHLLLDAALLHQEYPQVVVPSSPKFESSKVNLAGRLCDPYDIFPISEASVLDGAEPGKFVAFYNVGAYSIVFNMPFHCQPKPAVVMRLADGNYLLARRAQSLEDLFTEEGGRLEMSCLLKPVPAA